MRFFRGRLTNIKDEASYGRQSELVRLDPRVPLRRVRSREHHEQNIDKLDQVVRLTLGLSLPFLYGAGEIGVWGLLGFFFLTTGLRRFSPLYGLLGISTCTHETP